MYTAKRGRLGVHVYDPCPPAGTEDDTGEGTSGLRSGCQTGLVAERDEATAAKVLSEL